MTDHLADELATALYATIDHYLPIDPPYEGWHGIVYFFEAVDPKINLFQMDGWNITERVLKLLDRLDAEADPTERKRRER